MAGYRDTLHLPATEFPMKAGLAQREPERLAWWKEKQLYAALRAARRGRPLWLLHDGPPYSNAHLHMGTAANKIWKDAAVRQANLMGFDAPYLPGWDNHGMPIEIRVGTELREKGGAPPDRLALRRACRAYATKWVGIQREEFERLGVWGEWEDPYLTMAPGFEAAILEAFAALAARGFIQRGQRSIHWCPTDRTALAEAEIEYHDDPSPSIYVTFPLRRDPNGALAGLDDVQAVAWTTTPWTLPANLGLMVAPQAKYVVVRAGGRRYLVAEARRAAVAEAAGWSDAAVERHLSGADLVDAICEAPWGGDSRVVDGTPFVSMEDGTGLVHTAPGHGKEDFEVGQRAGLGILCPVDEAGRFMAGTAPFEGRSVLDVNDDIIAWLKERGRLLAASRFTHAYPHCWRCRKPVIFRATDQWFMIIDHVPEPRAAGAAGPPLPHRERALALIEKAVAWDPASSQNRIRESVRGRPDWCLSRQRSWGVGIPAIYCEACGTPHLDAGVMANAAKLTRERDSDVWFERPVEDFLPPGFACPNCASPGPFRKETDILDVWFDSGSTHRAAQTTHPTFRAAWAAAWAAESRAQGGEVVYFEGPDQHRGWFNSSLMVSAGIEEKAPYTRVCTHGWVLDGQGRAMHKSIGNVIEPKELVQKHGADLLRWWALATDWRSDVRVGDEILQRVADAYRKVRNTFRFLLGNLGDFDPARDAVGVETLTRVDRAFRDFLRARVGRMREAYAKLEFHRALDQLLDVCTVHLSAVYLDVTKDRLYTLAAGHPERRSAQTVLWEALESLAIAAAPALAFTAEEVWQHHPALVATSPSVHLAEWAKARAGDEAAWEMLLGLRNAVNAKIEPLRAAKTIATTLEAEAKVAAPAPLLEALAPYRAELKGFLMVAEARLEEQDPGPDDAIEYHVAIAPTTLPKCERCWTHRADVAKDGAQAGLCAKCVAALATTRK